MALDGRSQISGSAMSSLRSQGLAGAVLSHQHRGDCVSAEGEVRRTDHVHAPRKRLFSASAMIHAYLCQGSDGTYGKPESRPQRGQPLGSHWKGGLSSITRFNNLEEETTYPYFHINLPNFYILLIFKVFITLEKTNDL